MLEFKIEAFEAGVWKCHLLRIEAVDLKRVVDAINDAGRPTLDEINERMTRILDEVKPTKCE